MSPLFLATILFTATVVDSTRTVLVGIRGIFQQLKSLLALQMIFCDASCLAIIKKNQYTARSALQAALLRELLMQGIVHDTEIEVIIFFQLSAKTII